MNLFRKYYCNKCGEELKWNRWSGCGTCPNCGTEYMTTEGRLS